MEPFITTAIGSADGIAALLWIPFGAVSILHLVLLRGSRTRLQGITKALLIPLLMAGLFGTAAPGGGVSGLVLAGLAFGWIGDLALQRTGDRWFLVGLGSFFVGHILYIRWFVLHIGAVLWWPIAPVGVVLGGAAVILWNQAGALRIPAIAYAAVLTVLLASAVAAATGSVAVGWSDSWSASGTAASRCAVAGAALFLVSDALLGLREFTPWIGRAQVAVMATYIPAQLCIGLSGLV